MAALGSKKFISSRQLGLSHVQTSGPGRHVANIQNGATFSASINKKVTRKLTFVFVLFFSVKEADGADATCRHRGRSQTTGWVRSDPADCRMPAPALPSASTTMKRRYQLDNMHCIRTHSMSQRHLYSTFF